MSLYEYHDRKNVRYYNKNGEYVDHGRMIYKEIPNIGDIVSTFHTIRGECKWKVLEIRFPNNDTCMELQFEEVEQ